MIEKIIELGESVDPRYYREIEVRSPKTITLLQEIHKH